MAQHPENHHDGDDEREEHGTLGEGYAPPAPEPNAARSPFLLTVLALVALCVVVVVVALVLR